MMTHFHGKSSTTPNFLVWSGAENSLTWVTVDLLNKEKITNIPLLHLPRKLFFHSGNVICSLSPQIEQERRKEKESQLFQALSNAVPYPWELPPPPLSLSSSPSLSPCQSFSSPSCSELSHVPLPRDLVVQKCEYLQVWSISSLSSVEASLPQSHQTRFSLMEGEQTLSFCSFKQFLLVGTGFTNTKKLEKLSTGRLLLFSVDKENENPILNLQHSHKIGEKSEEMGKGKGGVSALATYCHQKFWGGRKVFFAGIGKELCLYFIIKAKKGFSFFRKLSVTLPSFILSIQLENNNDEINVLTVEDSLVCLLLSQQNHETRLDMVAASYSLTVPQSMAKISKDFLVICDQNGKIQSFGSHHWGPLTTIQPWTTFSAKDSFLMKQIYQKTKTMILCASFSGNIYLLEEISRELINVHSEEIQKPQERKKKKCLLFQPISCSQIITEDFI